MDVRPLTLADLGPWARLLAVCFDRSPEQMEALLLWFHAGFPLETAGVWDGDRLVAQYNCRLLELRVPGMDRPVRAGMGLNMAVDPAYRGRGLLELVATPVHARITERGCVAGVGFSSSGGLAVTRASASYGYRVLGPMDPLAIPLTRRRYPGALRLMDTWPQEPLDLPDAKSDFVRYRVTPESLRHRFADHPFRRYAFGARLRDGVVYGLVIYRRTALRGVPAASLLAAYGDDLSGLVGAWAGGLRPIGLHVAHVVVAPASPLRDALATTGPTIRLPASRSPYHLITRSLVPETPDVLFDLRRWDCTGGDIL